MATIHKSMPYPNSLYELKVHRDAHHELYSSRIWEFGKKKKQLVKSLDTSYSSEMLFVKATLQN